MRGGPRHQPAVRLSRFRARKECGVAGQPRGRLGRLAGAVAGAGIAVAALVALPYFGPADPPSEGCPRPFPRAVLAPDPGSGRSSGISICTDTAGTSTLLINDGPDVWTVDATPQLSMIRVRFTDRTRSFTDLTEAPTTAVPSGSAAVVPASPSSIALRVDARLTVAQLTHDQLLRTL